MTYSDNNRLDPLNTTSLAMPDHENSIVLYVPRTLRRYSCSEELG